eukprot:TRINITY_DN558_c0_g1_i2.p1 TRINITY_DN558_c0_g1~~TRINITY_DN558_c0_g1_i2.p1  ORF type:complete len:807 (-),score=57.36 TRINITY_DN558_c0_g1_i2:71-2416(-)
MVSFCSWIVAALSCRLLTGVRRNTEEDSFEHKSVQLCHPSIVQDTCRNWNGELNKSPEEEPTSVTFGFLADLLSANARDTTIFWTALGLDISEQEVSCQILCDKLVKYVKRVGGVLPASSDTVCITVNGTTTCDKHVDPIELAHEMVSFDYESRPHGHDVISAGVDANSSDQALPASEIAPSSASTTSQASPDASSNATTSTHSVWNAVESIAGQFRFYPTSGSNNMILHGALAEMEASFVDVSEAGIANTRVAMKQQLETHFARAKVWVSQVQRVMSARGAAAERAKWFGGTSKERITKKEHEKARKRLVRTFNFIAREFSDGVHFVYPADEATAPACFSWRMAYVYLDPSRPKGSREYRESQGPKCSPSDDPKRKWCAVDSDGKYYVYLCNYMWKTQTPGSITATLIHELAHHSNTDDVSYSSTQAKGLPQEDQLFNAANYEFFAADVVNSNGGCVEINSGCAAAKKKGRCTMPLVREVCPRSCGVCVDPNATTKLSAAPLTPTTTSLPAAPRSPTTTSLPSAPPIPRTTSLPSAQTPKPEVQSPGKSKSRHCFPPGAAVLLAGPQGSEDAFETTMQSLSPGDRLLGLDGEVNTYLLDFHGGASERATLLTAYLRIEHDLQKRGRPLLVTANHLVSVITHAEQKVTSIPAGEIRPGEHALFVSGAGRKLMPSNVRLMDTVYMPGFSAPLTSSGQLFVENVLVSSYALLSEAQLTLWQRGPQIFRDETQRICHMIAFPFRFAHALGLGTFYLDVLSSAFDHLSAFLLRSRSAGCHATLAF